MRYKKRILAVLLGIVCAAALCACGKQNIEETKTVVYEFGDCQITYGEYFIYAKTVEEDYQKAYGNGVWSLELTTDTGKSTVKEVTVQDIISNINRVKVLVAQAEEMNITLSDNERAEAENAATAFYNGLTEKDLSETEITLDIVKQVIEENMIAGKVYDQVIADYDFEISEEEARMTTFYDMVFECYSVKKDGSVEEYTDEKKATQLEKANEALSSLAQEEDVSYESIVNKYNLQYSASYTMSRTEMVEEYGESVADKILALSDGEVSTVIQSEYGYHIFKMLKVNDEDLTKKNKEEIIASKQKEYFNGIYEDWLKHYDARFNMEEDVNMELANKFPFTDTEE
ncbi:MAG: peptidyl-prolyl cis-trans isomerase [Lachnospiraceae bacterium]